MANVYIKTAGSENTNPAASEAVPLDNGTTSGWSQIGNLLKNYVASLAQGDILYYSGSNFVRLAAGTSGQFLKTQGASANPAWATALVHGQCYLSKSSTNLLLSPYDGNQIIINSVPCTIPDAGVTLAPPAVASTTYYIYAYMNSGTMTLEQSATAPAAQAGTGVQIKTGDATRTLVGQARTTSGNAWADSATQMFVLSYFNRRPKVGKNLFTANRTTTSTTFVEVNTEIRIEWLTWADESVVFGVNGVVSQNTVNYVAATSIGIDGTTAEDVIAEAQAYTNGASIVCNFSWPRTGITVGYHYSTVLGYTTNTGTATWLGGVGNRSITQNVTIRG